MLQVGWAISGVAPELDVSHTSIPRRSGTGRVIVTQPEQDNNLVRYIREHPFHICRRDIQETGFPGSESTSRNRIHERNISCRRDIQETGFPGSESTSRNRIHERNIRGYLAAIKLGLTEKQLRQRLRFAETHLCT
ncbi:Transposase [Popillia japonica]|uniref:Transposase n=1 Tax=Popillia japonica TaxID=7064 RepID=A0AAW1NKX5_POPJA